ncbi:MAG: family 78 glycoside hydrolase catalytic domain [Planctomycetia bacterium]|nr:family 78 glycoside hydrolase catalytic domain [Planctomycetia bacterium]
MNTNIKFQFTRFVLFVSMVFFLAVSSAMVLGEADVSSLKVVELQCESFVNPMGIDAVKPRLSWRFSSDEINELQTKYQILVASSREQLEADRGDLWDSGPVDSGESIEIVYQGAALHSGQQCFWKVRAWDKNGNVSAWSDVGQWEMGLLEINDWQGDWINDGKKNPQELPDFYKDDPAPLFRHEFETTQKVKEARLYIAGLGYCEARLNGELIGDHVLDPPWTATGKRVFYSTFDVTKKLQTENKKHCLGVTLGNGWYNPLPMKMWGKYNIRDALDTGRPRFIAQLNIVYEDGSKESVFSLPNWKTKEGPILRNNIYLGEVYDARREIAGWDRPGFDDSDWKTAGLATEPIGKLQATTLPPIRVRDTFNAVAVSEPQPNVYVYDMGENFGGLASLKLNVPCGTKIVLRYGELLHPDGNLNPMTSVCGQIKRPVLNAEGQEESIAGPGAPVCAWQSDTYYARGEKDEIYRPRFTFHAFRYVEVVGLDKPLPLDCVQGSRLCTDIPDAGEFSCSNDEFNKIQDMCRRTFLSNVFSVQSDCPHRERFGYGGDINATCEAFMMNFDMSTFYAKSVVDRADTAFENGMMTDTAPFIGIQYCGLIWAMTHPYLVDQLYRYYGNGRLIEEQYETARRWLALVQEQFPNHIVTEGLSNHEGLETETPEILVTTMYYQCARILERLALRLGRDSEVLEYQRLAEEIAAAYRALAIDSKTGKVGTGTQAAQSFVLYTDYVFPGFLTGELREKVFAFLVDTVQNKDRAHLTTGLFGTKCLLNQLTQGGRIELAYRIANQPDFPGWRWMLQNGATTIWEHWQKEEYIFSHNHPMFGSISQWFFQSLGGIEPEESANGFDRIRIAPNIVDELDWVKTSYRSVRGLCVSNWSRDREHKTITFNVEIPVNVQATVVLPVGQNAAIDSAVLDTDGKRREISASDSEKIFSSQWRSGRQYYSLGSGHYSFTVPSEQ